MTNKELILTHFEDGDYPTVAFEMREGIKRYFLNEWNIEFTHEMWERLLAAHVDEEVEVQGGFLIMVVDRKTPDMLDLEKKHDYYLDIRLNGRPTGDYQYISDFGGAPNANDHLY